MKLPKYFRPDFISKTFFPDLWKEARKYNPKLLRHARHPLELINFVNCYDWAYYAYCLFPEVRLMTTYNHAWVEKKGRFYDSVRKGWKPESHPMFMKQSWDNEDIDPVLICSKNIEQFKEIWDCRGGGRRHHWDTMLDEIRAQGLCPLRS